MRHTFALVLVLVSGLTSRRMSSTIKTPCSLTAYLDATTHMHSLIALYAYGISLVSHPLQPVQSIPHFTAKLGFSTDGADVVRSENEC